MRIEVSEPVPDEFALIVGDVLHNLRSSLDSLVYELALKHHGGPLPDDVAKGLMFPVFRTAHKFSSTRKSRIGAVHPKAQDIIANLQPYAPGKRGVHDPLYVLNELSVMDKHRLPHLTLLLPKTLPRVVSPDVGPNDGSFLLGRIEGSAKIFRYARSTEDQEEVILDFRDTLDIGFGPEPVGNLKSAFWNLRSLRGYAVRAVVAPLTACLD